MKTKILLLLLLLFVPFTVAFYGGAPDVTAIAITGGTINGATVGATTPAAGTFTSVTLGTVAGGESISAQVTALSTAQVVALRASPITVVTAGGANTWIEVLSVVLTYDYATAAFTVAADEDLVIEYADGTDITGSIESAAFLDQVDDEIRYYIPTFASASDPEAQINNAVRIFNTGAGEIADGGGVVDVRVVYLLHSTGF